MNTGTKWIRGTVALLVVLACSLGGSTAWAQTDGTITGTVIDARDGSPLIGANVALREVDSPEIVDGTATDPDGNFALDNVEPGEYRVEVRFVGYRPSNVPVTLEAGESPDLTIELQLETASLEQVVVSASRRQEKVLDAPASISVLEPEQMMAEVSTSSVEAIRSAPGVDMAQTGIDRREVVLRGFNEAFSGSAFVLTDYREAAVPSLGVNVHSIMPSMPIDVERVEVVRGPGSALYGPGVTGGVIHYFTKGPFEYPGATVSVSGGQRGYFAGQGRYATTVGDNFGLKITGQYARADDWELDPSNPKDASEIERYRTYPSRDAVPSGRRAVGIDTNDDDEVDRFQLRREEEYQKLNINGLMQYRFSDETTLSLNGGYSELKGAVQSGIGTLQADGFGYSYGQIRLQSGGFFAQAFMNANDAGEDTYVYGSGNNVVDKGLQYNFQTQYDFGVSAISTQFITGADAEVTTPRTEGAILGRNEGDDQIQEYGAYAQSSTDLTESLSMTLAARLDYNNVVEAAQVSPRAALVYKLNATNTVRGSYNRSFSSPGTNSLFLDIEAQRRSIAGPFNLVLQGLGAADGYTFNAFRQTGLATSLLPIPPAGQDPGAFQFGGAIPTDQILLQPVYGVAIGGLEQRLAEGGPGALPAPFNTLTEQQAQAVLQFLNQVGQGLTSTTAGQLGIPDEGEDLGYRTVDGPVDIDPLEQTTTQTFELGYKGSIGGRVLIQIDGYYEQKKDFVGPLVVESPFLYAPSLTNDLNAALAPIIQGAAAGDPQVQGLLQQLGLTPEQAAGLIAGLVGGNFEGNPLGIVQPDQQVLPSDTNSPTNVGGFLSYRNFGEVQYWGIDASVEVQATDELHLFANTSIVSDDFFDNEELDETNTALSLALNAPSFKVKGGFDYRFSNGFQFGATTNYVQGFPVSTGPYVGEVDDYFLVDVRAGYLFQSVPGLRLDVTAKNVLDNEHREFVGAPAIGRFLTGRLTYTIE